LTGWPAVLDSINRYSPVVIINGLAAILFMIGYVLFGIAMIKSATLPRWSGVLVAVGAPAHLLGFGIAQFVTTAVAVFVSPRARRILQFIGVRCIRIVPALAVSSERWDRG
jgi:hypothetical protein